MVLQMEASRCNTVSHEKPKGDICFSTLSDPLSSTTKEGRDLEVKKAEEGVGELRVRVKSIPQEWQK